MLSPKRTKFHKQHRGRMTGISCRGNHICFGRYALQALEPAWITARQIEAGRRAMTRYARRGVKIWVRIFPNKTYYSKTRGNTYEFGEESPKILGIVVKPGRLLYEMGGVSETVARAGISIVACKVPIRTQFVIV